MNAKKFSDAMSELDTKYIDEALSYKKKAKMPIWVKWGAIAACLCLMIPLTAFAVDIIQYHAAVDYLNSLGIAVEDLSDYSHKEIKEAAKRSSHYTIALEEIEACIADQKTVEDEIEARELARIIEDFLDTLTVENRVIFMRRYWFSDSYKDIAELVGLSEKNISVRLTRIREKMKQYLIEREVFV